MAVRDASIDAVIANPSHSGRCVVYIGDSAGAVTALGTVGGVVDLYDPLEGAEVTFSIDAHGTCTLRVKRQLGKWSFSPLSVGGGNPLQPTEARFAYGRRVQVFAYVTPPDAGMNTPATTRWVFDGVIDSIAWPNETMEIVCSDRTGTLRDTFIERERMYGFCTGATRGAEVWRYDIGALGLNTVVVPSKLRQTGHWYFVSVAGTPAVTEPAWPTGAGATVVSGTCTFTEGGVTSLVGQSAETIMGQLLTDNPSTGSVPHPALYTPVASGWVIKPFIQSRMSLLKALEVFPEQIGWRLHMWWDQANAVGGGAIWYLRFIVPDRARAVVDKTIPLDHETDCSDLSTNGWMVRNVIHVVFPDTTSRDPGGQPWRVTRIASDAPSIAANGRRFMEIREDDTSQIQTAAQADTLAAAVLADLKDAPIGLSVQIPSDPWCDVGDMVKVLADGFRYSTDQTLAAQQVKHAWGDQSARTELTLLGKPAARREGWLVKDTRLRGNDPYATVLFDSESITESLVPVIGGARFGHSGNGSKQGLEPHYEIHISETPAFTVSAATLKAVAAGDSESRELAGLIPGKTYYRQTVPFSYNAMKKVRGSPSVETSFVAGRAKAGHLDSLIISKGPPNGKFQTALDDLASFPPDHWELTAGQWDAAKECFWGTTTTNGRYVTFNLYATSGILRSGAWPIPRGVTQAKLITVLRPHGKLGAGRGLNFKLYFYAEETLTTAVGTTQVATAPYTMAVETWAEYVATIAVPAGANFVRVTCEKESASSAYGWDCAGVYFEPQVPLIVETWTAPTWAGSWGDVGGGWSVSGYLIDPLGFVRLRGLAKWTGAGPLTALFTLPAGYRPASQMQFPVRMGTGVLSYLLIATSGVVSYGDGVLADAQAGITLDGIAFDTR